MKRFAISAALVVLAAFAASAQLPKTSVTNGSGAPVGACISGSAYTDSSTGFLWTCISGAWTQNVVPTMVLLSVSNPSGTPTVSFTSIPQTYRHLYLTVYGQTSIAATFSEYDVTLNGDTGNNYDAIDISFNNGTSTSGAGAAIARVFCGWVPGATGPANSASGGQIYVFNYAQTTFQKVIEGTGHVKLSNVVSGLWITRNNGWWRNTAAVNRVDVTLNAGNWVAGSQICLYGVN